MPRMYDSEKVISLPLAELATDEIQKELFKTITNNEYLNSFMSRYTSRYWYDYCIVCGAYDDGCYCSKTENNPNRVSKIKIYDREQVIKLPLAETFTEDVQQGIYTFLNAEYNKDVMEFIKKYSSLMTTWYGDQCYICGQFPNGCNCDGYYNPKEK